MMGEYYRKIYSRCYYPRVVAPVPTSAYFSYTNGSSISHLQTNITIRPSTPDPVRRKRPASRAG